MNEIDELVGTFRTEIDVTDGMVDRVARGAANRIGDEPAATRPPRRPGRRRFLVPAFAASGLTAAAVLAVLAITDGGPAPSIIERAEAAIAPPNQILHLVAKGTQINLERGKTGVVAPIGEPDAFTMEDWSLAGNGQSMRMRRLISSNPKGQPPSDEDSQTTFDADGRLVDVRSWTPQGGVGDPGELTLGISGDTEEQGAANTWTGILRDAYETGRVTDAGTTDDGLRRLTGRSLFPTGTEDGCETVEVNLDPRSFLPKRLVIEQGCLGEGSQRNRMVIAFDEVERLETTPANLDLLNIGPWKTARVWRVAANGDRTRIPLAKVPPAPVVG